MPRSPALGQPCQVTGVHFAGDAVHPVVVLDLAEEHVEEPLVEPMRMVPDPEPFSMIESWMVMNGPSCINSTNGPTLSTAWSPGIPQPPARVLQPRSDSGRSWVAPPGVSVALYDLADIPLYNADRELLGALAAWTRRLQRSGDEAVA